jgi:hypothetical protein
LEILDQVMMQEGQQEEQRFIKELMMLHVRMTLVQIFHGGWDTI